MLVCIARMLAALLLVMGLAGAAAAAEPDARAKSRALFVQGVAALDDTRPRDALTLFERAYELFPHFATLYNIGLCHRALGQNAEAANALQRYLDEGGVAAPSDETTRVKALLTELDAKTATLTVAVSATPNARMTIDGHVVRAGSPVRVEPGEHVVEAADYGTRTARKSVTLRAGERRSLALSLEPASVTAPSLAPSPAPDAAVPHAPGSPSPEEPPRALAPTRFNTTFWVAAGTSVAGLAVLTIAGTLASSAHSAYEGATTDAQAEREKSRGQTFAAVADVGLVVSLAAAVVAVIVAVRPIDDPPPRNQLRF